MPTYGRPGLVENAIACFLAQRYARDQRRLIILDDAGQIPEQQGEGWRVHSVARRFATLAQKYRRLQELDDRWADAYAIWEDDDIYLPWHLSAHAAALDGHGWSHPTHVWSPAHGKIGLCETKGGYWASSAVRAEILREATGFIDLARADFDQQNLAAWRHIAGEPGRPTPPAYVYGWGRSNHGSARMKDPADTSWYEDAALFDSRIVGRLHPAFDAQTQAYYRRLAPSWPLPVELSKSAEMP